MITADPMMDYYTVGLLLTLRCVMILSTAVNTPHTLNPVWRREGEVLSANDQLSIGEFISDDDRVYTILLEFQPITNALIGNDTVYECEASVVPEDDTFVTGTTTNTSTTITVEGEWQYSCRYCRHWQYHSICLT